MPAPNRRRTRGSLANLLGDVIDDTKDIVDDALDRAGTLERDVRRGARRALDDDAPAETKRAEAKNIEDGELAELKAALEDLTAKVERLTRLRGDDKPAQ